MALYRFFLDCKKKIHFFPLYVSTGSHHRLCRIACFKSRPRYKVKTVSRYFAPSVHPTWWLSPPLRGKAPCPTIRYLSMLDQLTEKLSGVLKTIRGQARLTEDNIAEALRAVRLSLLEADVALPVVKDFLNNVKEKAMGHDVLQSLTPGQAFVGIVSDELTRMMGSQLADINLNVVPPAVILMAGLQGSGKTTTTGKLAALIKNDRRKKVLVTSCDIYRPAAIDQLATVASQLDIDCFPSETGQQPVDIAKRAIEYAKNHYYDVLIIDTAGRLAIDEAMMDEIAAIHQASNPAETLFVIDAMQGQDAVRVAKTFSERLALTGIIVTKLDGDARGGAMLSVAAVTQKPIKFIGTGEKLTALEPFHPERMASRVLGMGDILSLIESAHKTIDEKKAQDFAKKVKSGKGFDFNDFKEQMVQVKKMGGIGSLMEKLPMPGLANAGQLNLDDSHLKHVEAIINSMTPLERRKPDVIKASRKRRIATGSGTSVQEVNRLLKQFEQTQKMMKMFSKGRGMMQAMKGLMGRR